MPRPSGTARTAGRRPASTVVVPAAAVPPDVRAVVASEGLRYVSDEAPGYRRVKRRDAFAYLDTAGRRIVDPAEVKRIDSLAIPPAYTEVWICPLPNGHLQATGRDARGRKQYRYHPRWRAVRDAAKFDRMLAFGRVLPKTRRRVTRDLRRPGMPREKVLATIVRLLDETLIRVGNEEYAKKNGSYGLTTMRNRHVDVSGATMQFEFKGKSGIRHRVVIEDPRLARIVRKCLEIPGQELFQYLEPDGTRRSVDSADVNDYLRQAAGGDFTAKDFRTWHATVLALSLLASRACETARDAKRHSVEVVKEVAGRLGNTPSICRKSYVHPELLERYLARTLELDGSLAGERTVVALLERWSEPLEATLRRSMAKHAASGPNGKGVGNGVGKGSGPDASGRKKFPRPPHRGTKVAGSRRTPQETRQ